MATGDEDDFIQRLRLALPLRWFPDQSPVLDGVLSGFASAWAVLWDNLQFVRAQTRITTAGGEWLDAISADFFGGRLPRRGAEADDPFRLRIQAELPRPRGTRGALSDALAQLTGHQPTLFEPVDIRDTGGRGHGAGACGAFYGTAPTAQSLGAQALGVRDGGRGGYGNAGLRMQVLAAVPTGAALPATEVMRAAAGTLPCTGIAWIDLT